MGHLSTGSHRPGRAPYFTDWQFTVEYNITPNSLIRLTHHGNRGIKLQSMQQNLNQLDPKYWANMELC